MMSLTMLCDENIDLRKMTGKNLVEYIVPPPLKWVGTKGLVILNYVIHWNTLQLPILPANNSEILPKRLGLLKQPTNYLSLNK